MFKRKRDNNDDLPRKKRLHSASVSLLRRDWVGKNVLGKDGVQRNSDGTFSFRMLKGLILTRAQVDEIVKAVVTDTEAAYVKFSVEDGRMVISVENSYPAKSEMRREARKKEGTSWWKNIDMLNENVGLGKERGDVTADVVWSNELMAVPEYDRKCVMLVGPVSRTDSRPVICIVEPLSAKSQ